MPSPTELASVFKAFRTKMQVALETFLPSGLRNEALIHVFIMAAGLAPLAVPCPPSSHLHSSVHCCKAYTVNTLSNLDKHLFLC